MVHHCLRGHPDVTAARREVRVVPFFFEGPNTIFSGEAIDEDERKCEYLALFEGITHASEFLVAGRDSEEPSARGMKCAFGLPRDAEVIVDTLQQYLPEVRIVHVIRRNAAAQFVSLRRAERTGVWHREGEGKEEDAVQFCVDPYNFTDYAIGALDIREIMDGLRDTHDVLEISYENNILDGDITSHKALFEFIGVPYQRASWVGERKLSPSPREYIMNYGQIRALWNTIEAEYETSASVTDLRKKYEVSGLERLGKRMLFWGQHPVRAMERLLRA